MTTTVTAKITLRKGTAAQWTSANPILLSGEIGYETDTGKQKIGDGATAWTALAYHYDPTGADASGTAAGLIASHEAAANPHPGYLTPTEGDAAYAAIGHAHSGVYDPAGTATSAVSAHAGGTGVHAIASVTGLQTALDAKSATTHDHSGTYAPAANGVTNGDSHDHSGGDGAQISYSTLSNLPTLGTAAATAATDYATAAHNHSGVYEAAGAVSTHAALTTTHGISTFGASLVDDADAGTARTTLGLGTAATTAATDYATAAHTHAQLHDAVTVADSTSIDLTLTGQQISAAAIFGTTAGTICQGNDSRVTLAIPSNTTGITGADQITNIVSLTQAEYNAIGSKSATTLYFTTD